MASSLTATMFREARTYSPRYDAVALTRYRCHCLRNGTTSASMAVDAGANFVLGKPVQDGQLRSLLEIAVPRMAREHRRYFRHKVDLPVELWCYTGETFTGKILT